MAEEVQDSTEVVEEDIEALLETLAGDRRRQRQEASHQLAIIARRDVSRLLDTTGALVDALYRPEAQTRWEVLDSLSELVYQKADELGDAYDGAESSLFDEGSSTVRLSAFRFLTRYGSTAPERSDQVWGIVDEAIQCYHGDPEYRDMLVCLRDFAQGSVSATTRKALVSRIKFDAESSRGFTKSISEEIIALSKEAEKAAKKASKAKAEEEAEKPAKKTTRKGATKKQAEAEPPAADGPANEE